MDCTDRPVILVPGGWIGVTDCGRRFMVRRDNARLCDVACLPKPQFTSFPLACAWLALEAETAAQGM